jgi:hypothetical protein
MRLLTIGVGDLPTVLVESAAFAGFLVAAFFFAVKSMQKAV